MLLNWVGLNFTELLVQRTDDAKILSWTNIGRVADVTTTLHVQKQTCRGRIDSHTHI